jgi:hypothetical protein
MCMTLLNLLHFYYKWTNIKSQILIKQSDSASQLRNCLVVVLHAIIHLKEEDNWDANFDIISAGNWHKPPLKGGESHVKYL